MGDTASMVLVDHSIPGVVRATLTFAVISSTDSAQVLQAGPSLRDAALALDTYESHAPSSWRTQQSILSFLDSVNDSATVFGFLDAVSRVARELVADLPAKDAERGLSAAEAALLDAGGLALGTTGEQREAFERTAQTYAAIVAASLSVEHAARLLGVTGGRIRQRLLQRTLYGIKSGERRNWQLPSFQFYHGQEVPGLDVVLPHLPADLHPVEVYAWFTRPHSDLVPDGRSDEEVLSPRDWLIAGYPASNVAALAAELSVS